METTLTHKWTEAGIGQAPFTIVAMISVPSAGDIDGNFGAVERHNSEMRDAVERAAKYGVRLCSCEVCGMSLQNNVVIRDAAGKHFVVGTDCAEKSDDTKIVSKTRLIVNRRKREIAAAAREAKRVETAARIEAEYAEQRQRNGGLTDWEVQRAAEAAAAEAAAATAAAEAEKTVGKIVDVLNAASSHAGDFCASVARSLQSFDRLSDRAEGIVLDVYGKAHGRRNSKTYEAAYDAAGAMLDAYNAAREAR